MAKPFTLAPNGGGYLILLFLLLPIPLSYSQLHSVQLSEATFNLGDDFALTTVTLTMPHVACNMETPRFDNVTIKLSSSLQAPSLCLVWDPGIWLALAPMTEQTCVWAPSLKTPTRPLPLTRYQHIHSRHPSSAHSCNPTTSLSMVQPRIADEFGMPMSLPVADQQHGFCWEHSCRCVGSTRVSWGCCFHFHWVDAASGGLIPWSCCAPQSLPTMDWSSPFAVPLLSSSLILAYSPQHLGTSSNSTSSVSVSRLPVELSHAPSIYIYSEHGSWFYFYFRIGGSDSNRWLKL